MILSRHTTQNSHGVAQKATNCRERTEGLLEIYNLTNVPAPYQIRNFYNFCEYVAPVHGKLKIHLITGSDSNEEEVALSGEYHEIKKTLEQERITLTYDFDRDQHDRSIKTDTGWRITLGRGLDIFKKPEGRFTLGFVDQAKRECKATTITYTKVK